MLLETKVTIVLVANIAGIPVGSARGVGPQDQAGHGVRLQHELTAAL